MILKLFHINRNAFLHLPESVLIKLIVFQFKTHICFLLREMIIYAQYYTDRL